ncbi:prepilin-type N-terminal cleavage/methylation domain-containing protein [Aquabacterium lacunae]|uniref:Prepilin-type N-terminal cleavage/methylation domain-containing protein n=2 Tax=Aquabacterium lacunae TaxID=2528630 RepID=A0A4V2JFM6_9BURK|nr:prepilin-type N-terminal cleavage/methylation domain-containing protein [Aquabacterium lacunae]
MKARGFTLIELLVTLAVIATLLSLVAPRFVDSLGRADEAALKTNLRLTREALDKFKADTGAYPQELTDLVVKRYIREVPFDPVGQTVDGWILLREEGGRGITDLKSGAEGLARDGSKFSDW